MRMPPLLPLLLSSVALPAAAADYSVCYFAADSVSCLIEQVEFARQRNAEIDASIARVEARRARELALSLTHCKSRYSRTPRCLAERAQRFADRQNELAEASIARVAQVRAYEAARNAEIERSLAAVAAERQRRLEIAQNALIEASLAAVEAEKQRRFAARQNALATASVIRVEIERNRRLAASLSPCKSADDQRPRCLAQRAREFAAQQNAIATASAARIKAERERAFATARNAEIERSISAVARNRAQTIAYTTSHCAQNEASPRCEAERNRELQASLTHCKSGADTSPRCTEERNREFHIARNAEINRSIAAVESARAQSRQATASTIADGSKTGANASASAYDNNASSLETGALGIPVMPTQPQARPLPQNELRHGISTEPCRAAGAPFGPLHFAHGLDFDATMRNELDRLAGLAKACPGMRIEIHGYSDGTGPAFTNRSMAQARAQAVTGYLIAAGIAPNRLAAIGRGATQPVLPYSKGIDPAYGRRVEFVIKDPAMDAAARKVMWDLAELLDPTYIPAVAGLSP
ncbi:MAG: OmpA family protein [Hyphomicrobium sp.]|uniref:OmpA family protein n=1 Tax=Hyphomicrobium sp. TaxID=82 RepID=UPI00132A591C|nr:OmpA family protein [Hyphomicrobium sp.]KAB2942266.1 MAG: OmpA family protein [Hyphomicrobium sp.]MBZ0208409.1 OmpA family protein [Hyphomicrobium sp.]